MPCIQKSYKAIIMSGLISLSLPFNYALSKQNKTYIKIQVLHYSDTQCKKIAFKGEIDTSKKCRSYQYTDKAGKVIHGSENNFRCYPHYFVMDFYPFSGNCKIQNPKDTISLNHKMSNQCRGTFTHDPKDPSKKTLLPTSERLTNYIYPGNLDCSYSSSKPKKPTVS